MVPFIRCKESLNTTPGRALLREVREDLTVSFLHAEPQQVLGWPCCSQGSSYPALPGFTQNWSYKLILCKLRPFAKEINKTNVFWKAVLGREDPSAGQKEQRHTSRMRPQPLGTQLSLLSWLPPGRAFVEVFFGEQIKTFHQRICNRSKVCTFSLNWT